jgi:hypothetical protein
MVMGASVGGGGGAAAAIGGLGLVEWMRGFLFVLLESFLEREIDTCVSVFASVGTVWNVVGATNA